MCAHKKDQTDAMFLWYRSDRLSSTISQGFFWCGGSVTKKKCLILLGLFCQSTSAVEEEGASEEEEDEKEEEEKQEERLSYRYMYAQRGRVGTDTLSRVRHAQEVLCAKHSYS